MERETPSSNLPLADMIVSGSVIDWFEVMVSAAMDELGKSERDNKPITKINRNEFSITRNAHSK